MAYIDYLDPSRAGDLTFQRQQRTAELDRELGYDIAGYGGNQQRIQARGQQYGRDRGRLNDELDAAGLDPFYGRNQQAYVGAQNASRGLRDQARAAVSQPSYFSTPQSSGAPGGGFSPAQTSLMKYGGAQGTFESPANAGFTPGAPRRINADAMQPTPKPDGADYSTAGQNQQPRTDDLAKYGGVYNGGRWQAYGAPNASLANDRPQQFFNSEIAGRRNYQDYLGTLQRNEADFQANQKSERQQRLRGSLMTNYAGRNSRTGMPELRTTGRAPTEAELSYA